MKRVVLALSLLLLLPLNLHATCTTSGDATMGSASSVVSQPVFMFQSSTPGCVFHLNMLLLKAINVSASSVTTVNVTFWDNQNGTGCSGNQLTANQLSLVVSATKGSADTFALPIPQPNGVVVAQIPATTCIQISAGTGVISSIVMSGFFATS
jgi:hypothetical protein